MSSACALCMISMNRTSFKCIYCIFYKSCLIQCICMNCRLYVIFITHGQAIINRSRCRPPVLMQLHTAGSCFDLFCNCIQIGRISFSKKSKIDRKFLCCLQHFFYIKTSRCTGCRIRSVGRSGSTADHRCDSAVECSLHLSRTNEMNMRIKTSGGHDQSFSRNHFCSGSNDKVLVNSIHDRRISCFSDSTDLTVFHSDICFHDSPVIHDHCIRDYCIRALVIRNCTGLSHTIPQRFSTAKLCFISIRCIILFYFNNKGGICQTDPVFCCCTIHICIFCSADLTHLLPPP